MTIGVNRFFISNFIQLKGNYYEFDLSHKTGDFIYHVKRYLNIVFIIPELKECGIKSAFMLVLDKDDNIDPEKSKRTFQMEIVGNQNLLHFVSNNIADVDLVEFVMEKIKILKTASNI